MLIIESPMAFGKTIVFVLNFAGPKCNTLQSIPIQSSRNSCVKKVCTLPVMPCFEPYVPRSKYRVCDSNKTAHDNCYHKPIGQHSCNYINLKCVSIPDKDF